MRERALKALDRLPPFSPVLNRLVTTTAREDVSFVEIAELIEKDTVLAGNVLRIVNSALYGLQGSVNSVRHAVSILGLEKLRNIVLSMSVARMWNQAPASAGWDGAAFNEHSVACGILSDLIASRGSVDYPEGAFVAGLLHDVGRMLIAISAPEAYAEIHANAGARSWVECEAELLGVTHAELSGEALKRWKLPEQICEAVLCHHHPGGEGRLRAVVRTADAAAHALGHSMAGHAAESPDAEILTLVEHFEAEYAAMKQFF